MKQQSGKQNKQHRRHANKSSMSTIEFFRCLYGSNPSGYLTLWTQQDHATQWLKASQGQKAAQEAAHLAKEMDVYYGVGLRERELDSRQRGTTDDVIAIPGLWLDVDIAGDAHKESNLPPSLEDATKLIHEFALPPSILVNTGHGIHAYWIFKRPWQFSDDTERAKAQTLMAQFQRTFQALAGKHGWKVDNTSDLARVLRVPGTYNRKAKPLPVLVVSEGKVRKYDRDEFSHHLVEQGSAPQSAGPASESETPNQAPAQAELILAGCGFLQHCRDDAATLPEPHWYAMISNLAPTDGGEPLIHDLSKPYPEYTVQDTEEKIRHALQDTGPHTCKQIEDNHGDQWCKVCPHKGEVTSPIVLGRPPWRSSAEALRVSSTKVNWLIEGVLPAGSVILLSGREGSMKTWLAMEWALSVAKGKPWLLRSTKAGQVLYMDAETTGNLLEIRLKALGTSPKLNIWQWRDRFFPRDLGDRQLRLAAKVHSLIVVDTLRRFMGKRDENSATEMSAITEELRELTRWGATVVVLHHAAKDPENRSGYRGSTELGAGVDIVCPLQKIEAGGNTELRLKTAKTRYSSEVDLTLRVERTDTHPIFHDASAEATAAHEAAVAADFRRLQEIIEELTDNGDSAPNQSQLVDRVEELDLCSRVTLRRRLALGEGRYWYTEKRGRQCIYVSTRDLSTCPMPGGPDRVDNREIQVPRKTQR